MNDDIFRDEPGITFASGLTVKSGANLTLEMQEKNFTIQGPLKVGESGMLSVSGDFNVSDITEITCEGNTDDSKGKIERILLLDYDNDGEDESSSIGVLYGERLSSLSEQVSELRIDNEEKTFYGFYSGQKGKGVRYYNEEGEPDADHAVCDKTLLGISTLYACWEKASGPDSGDNDDSDTQTTTNEDGTQTVTSTEPDGTKVEKILDASGEVQKTTKRSESTDSTTGEKVTTVEVEHKDGSRETTITRESADGSREESITKKNSDGSSSYHSEKTDKEGNKDFFERQEKKDGTIQQSSVSKDEQDNVTKMEVYEKTKSGETTLPLGVNGNNTVGIEKIETTEKNLVLPENVQPADGNVYQLTEIKEDAAKGNKKLESVGVGKKIRNIRKSAFNGCTKLKKLTGCDGVAEVGESAFYGCALKNVSLPVIRKLGKKSFMNNKQMKKLVIGTRKKKGGMQNADGNAAWGEAVKISIAGSALENCIKLKEVIINSEVTKIGNNAFRKCKALAKIVIYSLALRVVGERALGGVHDCKINVPKVRLKTYKVLFKNKGQGKKVVVAKM